MNPKLKNLFKYQFLVLLVGTLFAWTNFSIELYSWIKDINCPVGCPVNSPNPFLTPCFGGAVFFSIALVFSILIKKGSK
ncbi:MAG TPA: hypothetical protein VI795_01490 [Patescibacteria group bacterium]|nr:hypothetical protein [Patescibacteria group bacterium]